MIIFFSILLIVFLVMCIWYAIFLYKTNSGFTSGIVACIAVMTVIMMSWLHGFFDIVITIPCLFDIVITIP